MECVSSWLREIPVADVVNSPLFDAVVKALSVDSAFEAAVDCMCTILRDTREVDESIEIIQLIYPRLISLRQKIAQAAKADDQDTYKGLTRIFAEAGEHWVVMIARLPNEFRGIVEAILECCARDTDREAISLTFLFWYEFKQMITLEKYKPALDLYLNVFSKLVDIMIKHMEYPTPEGPDETDLFDGDREQEEKFREFRHQMGDVLKDCCEVITVTECLGKAFKLIQQWITIHGSSATKTKVPHWQELEAPLFAMRAMGRMVSPEESVVLHQVIPIIVEILKHVDHEKLRFQAIMALGRYTEWTSQHPEFLQDQLKFVMDAFKVESPEVVKAAALAFRFFGTDCRKLLADHVEMLHKFYESVLDDLVPASQEEVTEGVACVVSAQPLDKIYPMMKLYCDPIIQRMMSQAQSAKSGDGEKAQLAVAGKQAHISCLIRTRSNSIPRLPPAPHYLRPKRPTLRLSRPRKPCCQILRRYPPHHVRHCREFHLLRPPSSSASVAAGATWFSPTAPPPSLSSKFSPPNSRKVSKTPAKAASCGPPTASSASSPTAPNSSTLPPQQISTTSSNSKQSLSYGS